MGYETSKFGYGSNIASTVHNHYGQRDSKGTVGTVVTEGNIREVSLDIDGDMVGNEAFDLDAPVIPAGAVIKDIYVEVSEAFVLGGTSPVIEIGTEGSEATNGVTVTEAQAEAVGTYDVTGAISGTWASPLAAAATVGIDLAGTTPTVTDAGRMRVVIRYALI